MMHTIDAQAVWEGDVRECRRLYRQFETTFRGNFYAINSYYRFKRASMLRALRQGKPLKNMRLPCDNQSCSFPICSYCGKVTEPMKGSQVNV